MTTPRQNAKATPPGPDRAPRRRSVGALTTTRLPANFVQARRARRKFVRRFPGGFRDDDYVELERDYKWQAHLRWRDGLGETQFAAKLRSGRFAEIAALASRIESRTNLLFSFEKMALRDAIRSEAGAEAFSRGLFDLLHGARAMEARFSSWIETVAALPQRQTRVLTWPLVTVFGFIAQPRTHFFFKPTVTREAARRYGVELAYASRPSWPLYRDLLSFVRRVRTDIQDLKPRDMIDLQSFLWVQGSEEYPD